MYVLDGVQRLRTLARAFSAPRLEQPVEDGVDWRLYIDIKSKRVGAGAPEALPPTRLPTAKLRWTTAFMSWAKGITGDAALRPETRDELLEMTHKVCVPFRDHVTVATVIGGDDIKTAEAIARCVRR